MKGKQMLAKEPPPMTSLKTDECDESSSDSSASQAAHYFPIEPLPARGFQQRRAIRLKCSTRYITDNKVINSVPSYNTLFHNKQLNEKIISPRPRFILNQDSQKVTPASALFKNHLSSRNLFNPAAKSMDVNHMFSIRGVDPIKGSIHNVFVRRRRR